MTIDELTSALFMERSIIRDNVENNAYGVNYIPMDYNDDESVVSSYESQVSDIAKAVTIDRWLEPLKDDATKVAIDLQDEINRLAEAMDTTPSIFYVKLLVNHVYLLKRIRAAQK